MGLGSLIAKATRITTLAKSPTSKKVLSTVGSLTFWFGLSQIADALSRLRVQRGQLNLALKQAKKRCKFEKDYQKRQRCIRNAMIDFSVKMASTYQKEVSYYKSLIPKTPDEKTRNQIEKALLRSEKKLNYYSKLASLLKTTDMPITVAMEEAKKV